MKKYLSAGLILTAGVLWGLMGIFVDSLAACGFSTWQTALLRLVGAALYFALFLAVKDRSLLVIRLRDLPLFAGLGLFSILAMTCCYFLAIRMTSYSVAAILLYTAPVIVSVCSALFFGEVFTGRKCFSLALAVLGCALVSCSGFSGGVTAYGILFGLLSGIAYALYSILGKIALSSGYSPYTVSAYAFIFASLGALLVCDAPGTFAHFAHIPPHAWLWVVLIGLVSAFLPFLLYTLGLADTPPGKASVLATVEPLTAALCGLFRGQTLSLVSVCGMLFILAANFLQFLPPRSARKTH